MATSISWVDPAASAARPSGVTSTVQPLGADPDRRNSSAEAVPVLAMINGKLVVAPALAVPLSRSLGPTIRTSGVPVTSARRSTPAERSPETTPTVIG
ncbi:hypothetical protein D3C87_1867780 [compost metagenome]